MSDNKAVGIFENEIIAVYIILVDLSLIEFNLERAVRDIGKDDLCIVVKVGDNPCLISFCGVFKRVNVARRINFPYIREEIARDDVKGINPDSVLPVSLDNEHLSRFF